MHFNHRGIALNFILIFFVETAMTIKPFLKTSCVSCIKGFVFIAVVVILSAAVTAS